MKFYAAFALFVASFSTFSGIEASIITDTIVEEIENISQTIKDLGLDPVYIEGESGSYALPVPVIFNAAGSCEKVLSTGLSDIVINDIRYDTFGFRLTFDMEMAHIHFSAETFAGEAAIFNNKLYADCSGSMDIYNVRVKGDVRIGVLGGVGVRAVDIDSRVGAIDTNIKLNIQGFDLSDLANRVLGVTILDALEAFKPEVDEMIAIVLMNYINDNILS